VSLNQKNTIHARMAIAENLREIIRRDFESVSDFTRKVGLDRSGAQRWLSAEAAPSAHALTLMLSAGIDLNELFGGKR